MAALYILKIVAVGFPEAILAQLVSFFNHHLAAVERLHDFYGSTGNAIGPSKQQRSGLEINDAGRNISELSHLPSHGQPRWTATHDKHIDHGRQISYRRIGIGLSNLIGNLVVTRVEAIPVVLHRTLISAICATCYFSTSKVACCF